MTTALPNTCPHCEMNLVPYHDEARPLRFCVHCHFPLLEVAGKYRLVDILGKGGFGTVYHAKHTQIKREPERVIKVLKADLMDKPGMKARFFREVQLTSVLSQHNPHIIRVYDDFGEVPDLGFFYVMEYLKGLPLTHYLHPPSPAPPVDWSLEVFAQLCDAMHAAHNEGIIHRDIKPDNLMLISYRGRDNFVKVLDFGIAKPLLGETLQSGSLEVATKGILGTPFYIAPEQAMNRQIGPHTDIYSMGIILHEMLTGELPMITPKQRREMTLVQILRLRLEIEEIPPPSQVYPERNLPPALDAIFQKALHRDPNQRFHSAEAFWNAVAPFYQGHAPPPAFAQTPIGEPDAPPFAMTKPQEPAMESSATLVSQAFDPYATVLEYQTSHLSEQDILSTNEASLLAHAPTAAIEHLDPLEFQKTLPSALPTPFEEHTFLGEARPERQKRGHSKWIAPICFLLLIGLGAALAYHLKTQNQAPLPVTPNPHAFPAHTTNKPNKPNTRQEQPRPVPKRRPFRYRPKKRPPQRERVAPLPARPMVAPKPPPTSLCKSTYRYIHIVNFHQASAQINLYPSAVVDKYDNGVCIPIQTRQIIIEQHGHDPCQVSIQPSPRKLTLRLRENSHDPNADPTYCLHP